MLLQSGEINLAAHVSQMALVHIGGQVRVRFWCTGCNTAEQLVESDDAMMRVKKSALSTKSVLASLEHVALTRLMAEDKGDHYEFRYVF